MATLFEKYLIVDVFDVFFYDENDRLIFMSKNLTSASLTNSQDSVEVRNGKGNGLFSVLSTNKDVQVEVTENVFNFKNLALLTGSDIIKGSGEGYTALQELIVGTGRTIELKEAPVNGIESVQIEFGGAFITGTLGVDGKTVTFADGVVAEKDTVLVYPYVYATPEDSETITVNANKFPKGGKLVMQTYQVDSKNNRIADFNIILPKVMPTGEWSIETQSEVQPTDTTITMRVLQYNNNGDLYKLQIVPYK